MTDQVPEAARQLADVGFRPQVCRIQQLALVAVAVGRRVGGAVACEQCAALVKKRRICREMMLLGVCATAVAGNAKR